MFIFIRKYFMRRTISFIASTLDRNNRIILAANVRKCVIDAKHPKELKRIGRTGIFFTKCNSIGLTSSVLKVHQ